MPACTDRASPASSRIGISFPTVFRNFKLGAVSISVPMSLTVVSIPPASLAIRHIVSKLCSMCRGYHVAIAPSLSEREIYNMIAEANHQLRVVTRGRRKRLDIRDLDEWIV